MLEAMKIDVYTYNYYKSLPVVHKQLGEVNGMFLVREKGAPPPYMIFDMHEFHARYAWLGKTYGGMGFETVRVKPVDSNDYPLEPKLPGNQDPGYPHG